VIYIYDEFESVAIIRPSIIHCGNFCRFFFVVTHFVYCDCNIYPI